MTRTALWLFGLVALLVTSPTWAGAGPGTFTRGDVNEDASIDIGDPVLPRHRFADIICTIPRCFCQCS
ncbi:MAG: hypothetical protein AAF488_18435 [Planctomycetota bacterium]